MIQRRSGHEVYIGMSEEKDRQAQLLTVKVVTFFCQAGWSLTVEAGETIESHNKRDNADKAA